MLSGGLHPHYREVCATYARFDGFELTAPDPAPGAATIGGARRRRNLVRRRAEPRFLRRSARLVGARRGVPRRGRAAGRRRDRDRVVGPGQAARRDGRRHRRRRGPVDRQRAELRRALCRPLREARQIRAPDAGPARRRDRRCRGPARLGADAVDARAAYPPREGDEQHLHQFRPLRARLHDPSGAAGRSRARPARALNHADAVRLAERLERCRAYRLVNRRFFNEFALRLPEPAAPVVEALAEKGVLAGVPASRLYPAGPGSPICCWSPPPRPTPRTTWTGSPRGCGRRCVTDWSRALSVDRAAAHRDRVPPSAAIAGCRSRSR